MFHRCKIGCLEFECSLSECDLNLSFSLYVTSLLLMEVFYTVQACLELMYNGVAMSIQEGYSMLLGPDTGCTFNEYQTYMHLVRQGYIVLRHSGSIRATRYECQIRLHQYSVGQKQHKENVEDMKSPISTENMPTDVKTEEQEFIDVETVETLDISSYQQSITQKPENEITDCNNIVDVSHHSQTSHTGLRTESAGRIRCDTQNKTSLENTDEIEVVNVVDVKIDADNEIVEVNHKDVPSTFAVGCVSKPEQRKSCQNTVKSNAAENETQVLPAGKPGVHSENGAATNVAGLAPIKNSDLLVVNVRQPPNETSYHGRGRVTSINLEHDEVEILPSIIDISEEDAKQGPSCLKLEDINSASSNEIEVVDLEDDESMSEMSWEAERMQILDSIPSINGKFIIHVQAPDKSLLPKNVCPQKKEYYVQRCRLNAPGIGGKPTAKLPNSGAHRWQDNQAFHSDGHIDPWTHASAYNFGGGGNMFGAASVWSNNTCALTSPFRNQHYEAQFPGAYGSQTMFHQSTAMSSILGNPSWMHNTMYGIPAFAPMLQNARIPHGRRPLWHYHTRPYQPYFKRRRRRFQTQYNTPPTKLGEQHFENQPNSNDNFIPLIIEDKIGEGAPKTPPKNEGDGSDGGDEDMVGFVPVSSAVTVENPSVDWASGEGLNRDVNKNGTDRCTVHRRRKRPQKLKCSVPPKKLPTLHEKFRLEAKEQIRREDILTVEVLDEKSPQIVQQEDTVAANVSTWRDLKTVMQVVDVDSRNEGCNVNVDVNDIQGSETQNNEPLVQPEDCKDIGISELFLSCLPCCEL
jgi:hypothetical protein